MLCAYYEYMKSKKIVLGSKSVGRKRILEDAGLVLDVLESGFEEDLKKEDYNSPMEYVEATCKGKVESLLSKDIDFDLLIVADCVCTVGQKVIEKPIDKSDHVRMIKELRDSKFHNVITTVTLIFRNNGNQTIKHLNAVCEVEFANIPDCSIEKYLDYFPHCINVSGGYEMLKSGNSIVKNIKGSPSNVYGIPVCEVCEHIVDAIENKLL